LIALTTVPGQIVLDPFCGSGSTLVAAKATYRKFLGFEVNPDAVKVAKERLAPDMFEVVAMRDGQLA
jgi:site-specific DNA-methyltransferase (adenine-specific)